MRTLMVMWRRTNQKDLCLRHVTLARQGKSMNKNIIKRMDTTLLKNKSPLIYRY